MKKIKTEPLNSKIKGKEIRERMIVHLMSIYLLMYSPIMSHLNGDFLSVRESI